jgi:hypothetical protein
MTDDTKGASRDADTARVQPAQPVATARSAEGDRDAKSVNASGDTENAELRPISADMQQFIGRQLRAVFDDVAKQPIPDRFLELMKQLDTKTGQG